MSLTHTRSVDPAIGINSAKFTLRGRCPCMYMRCAAIVPALLIALGNLAVATMAYVACLYVPELQWAILAIPLTRALAHGIVLATTPRADMERDANAAAISMIASRNEALASAEKPTRALTARLSWTAWLLLAIAIALACAAAEILASETLRQYNLVLLLPALCIWAIAWIGSVYSRCRRRAIGVALSHAEAEFVRSLPDTSPGLVEAARNMRAARAAWHRDMTGAA